MDFFILFLLTQVCNFIIQSTKVYLLDISQKFK